MATHSPAPTVSAQTAGSRRRKLQPEGVVKPEGEVDAARLPGATPEIPCARDASIRYGTAALEADAAPNVTGVGGVTAKAVNLLKGVGAGSWKCTKRVHDSVPVYDDRETAEEEDGREGQPGIQAAQGMGGEELQPQEEGVAADPRAALS